MDSPRPFPTQALLAVQPAGNVSDALAGQDFLIKVVESLDSTEEAHERPSQHPNQIRQTSGGSAGCSRLAGADVPGRLQTVSHTILDLDSQGVSVGWSPVNIACCQLGC